MNKKMGFALLAAVALQFFVLMGMYVKAAMPLWTGQEIRLETLPVDPRSLFRGNYARLNYPISRIAIEHFSQVELLRNGEVVYTLLMPTAEGVHSFAGVSLERPDSGIFLRGRIEGGQHHQEVRVNYGLEAFFAPKDKALALEKELRDAAVAVVMVSASGRARLKEVVAK